MINPMTANEIATLIAANKMWTGTKKAGTYKSGVRRIIDAFAGALEAEKVSCRYCTAQVAGLGHCVKHPLTRDEFLRIATGNPVS